MWNVKKMIFIVLICFIQCFDIDAQKDYLMFDWPESPASTVFQEFIAAFNTGKVATIEIFVKDNYKKSDSSYVRQKVDHWMDLYYRFGEVRPHSISINEAYDLEIWLQGKLSEAWFAVEFILDKDIEKVVAVGTLQGVLPPGATRRSPSEDSMLTTLRSYLDKNAEHGLFQGSVLVQKGGNIWIDRAYGYKNIERQIKNHTDTRFDFMSITKLFTAVACLQLVQQGSLGLDHTIDRYLPKLPSHISSNITIEMLLSHTSGYELDGIPGFREALEKTNSMQEVYQVQLAFLPRWQQFKDFNPKDKYDYSNDSFDLLAIIIEKISGMRFEAYLKKYILQVAGLTATSFEDDEMASRYRYDISVDGLIDVSSYYPAQLGRVSGAAGLIGTTGDLQSFFYALIKTNKLLDYVHRSLIFSPRVIESVASNVSMNNAFLTENEDRPTAYNSYGLGAMISYEAQLNIGHSGVGIGNSSQLRYFPDLDILLIALSNNRSGAANVYNYMKTILPTNK